jgi:hypothetical protein
MLAAVFPQRTDEQRSVWSQIKGSNPWCCDFEINWAWATFYAFFIAYGCYGALAPSIYQFKQELTSCGLQLFLLAGIQVVLGWVAWKCPDSFKDCIKVTARDLIIFISLAVLLLFFKFDQLNFSLFSDELSYAGSAHGHAIYLAFAVARHFQWLDEYVFRYLVQAISILLFSAVAYLIYMSALWTVKKRIIVFVLLLIMGRFVFAIKGGNGSPHPPLQLIPPFIFGSLFGINDISFKLSYFLAYVGFLTLVCRMLLRIFPLSLAYFATLAVGTIPLLLNTSSVVEHSLWSFVCFGIVFTEILTSTSTHYFRLVGFVSIMTMMRQPSFLALLPVFLIYFIQAFQEGSIKQKLDEYLKLITLQLLFLPFLCASLIKGTPSTNAWHEGSNTDRVIQAIENGVVWDSMAFSLPFWWLVFIPLSFMPFQRKSWNLNMAFIVFFIVAIFIYYSIHPGLWGLAKYQVEYAGPLVIAGLIIIIKVVTQKNLNKKILLTLVMSLLVLNIMQLTEQKNSGRLQNSLFRIEPTNSQDDFELLKMGMTSIPYEYKKAYALIKQKGLSENTYSIGATYGILPEIMNGYPTGAVIASNDIYKQQLSSRLDTENVDFYIENIQNDSRIKAVILGSINKKQELISQLFDNGWKEEAIFTNSKYGTTVVIMTRP